MDMSMFQREQGYRLCLSVLEQLREKGLLTAEDGKFEPDGWTPKWRVIQVWNQAFPKE